MIVKPLLESLNQPEKKVSLFVYDVVLFEMSNQSLLKLYVEQSPVIEQSVVKQTNTSLYVSSVWLCVSAWQ